MSLKFENDNKISYELTIQIFDVKIYDYYPKSFSAYHIQS